MGSWEGGKRRKLRSWEVGKMRGWEARKVGGWIEFGSRNAEIGRMKRKKVGKGKDGRWEKMEDERLKVKGKR